MGASNFHGVNGYFVVSDDEIQDTTDWEYKKEYVSESLANVFGKKYDDGSGSDPYELRSYPSSVIGTTTESKDYAGSGMGEPCEIYLHCTVVARSAYHDGANFDYHFTLEIDGVDVDVDDDGIELELSDFGGIYDYRTEARQRQLYKRVSSRYDKRREVMEKKVIDTLSKCATPIRRVGGFSDGTSVYEKV